MNKTILFFILAMLIAACGPKSAPLSNPPVLTQRPIESPKYTPIPDETQAMVEEKLSYALSNVAYVEQESPSGEVIHYYQLIGLSTGNLHTLKLDGYQLDVLNIYLMMIPGPISVPVLVGIEDKQGGVYTKLVPGFQNYTKDDFLKEVAILYPRWQEVFIMLMGDAVTSTGVDWEACSDNDLLYCKIGQALEDAYQTEMQLLRIQALYRVPEGFVLPWILMPPVEPVEPAPTLSPSEIETLIPIPGD